MKIAIFHNYMDQIGGAEKLVLMLAKKLKADVITTNINKDQINKFGFREVTVKSIGQVPKSWPKRQKKTIKLFKKIDLTNKYDAFLISGEWALAGAKKNQPSVWYVHSLPKYIWDFYHENLNKRKLLKRKIKFKFYAFKFKKFIKKYAFSPKIVIGNSNYTQRKLIRNLKRDSILIYPPVNNKQYSFKKYGDFWLSVNRITKDKRIEPQLKTFSLLPDQNLKIVGSPENKKESIKYFQNLKNKAPSNIEFLGDIGKKELKKLYSNCRGLIATAKNEDFGLTPIEAMASGKPVVAVNKGGYKETINKQVGILTKPRDYKLAEAIKIISQNPGKYKNNCLKKSQKYSLNNFTKKIRKVLKAIAS